MSLLLSLIIFYIVLGGLGMYLASKGVDVTTSKARWLKFITYILIVSVIITCILFRVFYISACVIAAFGLFEIARTFKFESKISWMASMIYILIATSFLFFAFRASYKFQFFIYFQVLTFDAFCQVTGQLFGKHKMAPRVSPSKTWEGLAGGFVFCILSSIVASHYLGVSIKNSVVLGVVTAVAAFCGDMLASWYKRKSGIKDYSNFLPGQGGFLDRFDSLMVVCAVYVVLYILNTGFKVPYFLI